MTMTLLAGLTTAIGAGIAFVVKKDNLKALSVGLGFSAGVMIFLSFTDIIPEAGKMLSVNFPHIHEWLVLLGFILGVGIAMLIDYFLPDHIDPDELLDPEGHSMCKHRIKRAGLFTAIAICVHNFPEGMATFIGALNDAQMGAGITFAIAVHNIPEGIAVAIPIYYATKSKSKSLLYATLSGLTEPVGAGICYGITALSGIQIESAGAAFPLILSAVAGIMIYISLDELLPTAEKYGKHHIAIAGVVAGMAVMGVSLLLL